MGDHIWAFPARGTTVQRTEGVLLLALVIGNPQLQEHRSHMGVGCVWGDLAEHCTDTSQSTSFTDTRVGFLGMDATGLAVLATLTERHEECS